MENSNPFTETVLPVIAHDLNTLETYIDKYQHFSTVRQQLTAEVENVDNKIRNNDARGAELTAAVRLKVLNSSELDDFAKVALLSAMDVYGQGDFTSRVPVSPNISYGIHQEAWSIYTSLKNARRLTSKPNTPLLYFEAHGGDTYLGINGTEYQPNASRFFTARTVGSGLQVHLGDRHHIVIFDINNLSADNVPNFISGYLDKTEKQTEATMQISRPELVVSTTSRTSIVLRRSIHNMQTNAIYMGEAAVRHATQFLLNRMVKIDCDIPGVFSKTKLLHLVNTGNRKKG